jgi:hypothetical protein
MATADALMLTVGVAVRVIAAAVAVEEDQGSVAVVIRVLVANVVASTGTADVLMLTVGVAVRVNAAAAAAAGSLAKQLITLFTFVSTFETAVLCSLQHQLAGLIDNISS